MNFSALGSKLSIQHSKKDPEKVIHPFINFKYCLFNYFTTDLPVYKLLLLPKGWWVYMLRFVNSWKRESLCLDTDTNTDTDTKILITKTCIGMGLIRILIPVTWHWYHTSIDTVIADTNTRLKLILILITIQVSVNVSYLVSMKHCARVGCACAWPTPLCCKMSISSLELIILSTNNHLGGIYR